MLSNQPTDRSSVGRRFTATAALAAFVLMAVGSGCRGFFINQPNSLTVTDVSGASSFSVAVNGTDQLTATASYDSGNKIVTNSVSWQSSTPCAQVSTTGLVKGIGSVSSATVTATLAGVQGTITGSVTGGSSQTLTITPPSPITASQTGQFTATLNNVNVTSNSTWTSDDTTAVSFSSTTPGLATFGTSGQSANVTASFTQGTSCATGTLLVTIP